ncbi:chemotaxis protein CheW [Iningainema tapete]|uniref:Purine-binding chemotaxis protein CheW n=1 Tax=Iningainema tapete BLCC-T55 TaxID=2748662 RepID=A0A8J6XK00_9CYAN|nr:chemotaxis protein CheW [Iningainema tapete]MBD2778325.1 purine-binding chemotaxis protein CheW [Iningainema tapete BLCC-T55]
MNAKIAPTKIIQNNLGDGYLKFQLNRQTSALISMRYTQEAIVVPVDAVTSMPNMPTCILGLMNWRSRIVWAIDLSKMLNLDYLDGRLRSYDVIIVRVESMLLGLVVQEITGTAKFHPDAILSPLGHIASSLVPYLRGCVTQDQEILLVLDAQAIAQSSILRSD